MQLKEKNLSEDSTLYYKRCLYVIFTTLKVYCYYYYYYYYY